MNLQYALALAISACICAIVSLTAWQRRVAPGASGLTLFMLSYTIWAGTYAVRWMVSDVNAQLFWLDATYFGAAFNTTFFFIFTLQFTRRARFLTRRNLALLSVVPSLTLLILWTDPWHGWFYAGLHTTGSILNGGPWFWFFIAYTYLFAFCSLALLVQTFLRSSSLYRVQSGTILFAACLPLAGVSLGLAGFSPFPDLDITPFIFTMSGLVYAYGLFGLRLMDVVPVARDRLVEEMADGVIVLDLQNHLVDINPAVQRLTGIPVSAIGKPAAHLLEKHLGLQHFPDQTGIFTTELCLSKDPVRHVELQIIPLQNGHQETSGRLLILRDISERKQAEAELREAHNRLEQRVVERTAELQAANLQLEKAARIKDEFLASMSHELRTPLTGILGLSEVLELDNFGPLNDRQRSSVRHIHASGMQLLELINDILDLSRLSSGSFDLSLVPCSLAEICQTSLQSTQTRAQAKKLQSKFSISPESITVNADARRLNQMLTSLLGNAIKFTPEGGSYGIEVTGNRAEASVHITVWDTGIGILEEDLPRLFQPFVQLDARLARQYSGTGLGLALVHRLTALHGGSVTVQSAPSQGSRFTICLPWAGL